MAKIPTFKFDDKLKSDPQKSCWEKVTDLKTINNIITIVRQGLTKFSINSRITGETILIADANRYGQIYTDGRINFLGVRDDNCSDDYNDILYVYWVDEDDTHEKIFVCYKADNFTTKPGIASFFLKGTNPNGVAVMCEGWQRNIWCRGKHNCAYPAIRQYSSEEETKSQAKTEPMVIYRDKRLRGQPYNREYEFDFDYPEYVDYTTEEGITQYYNAAGLGINLHRSHQESTTIVGTNSAGCQVFKNHQQFEALMYIIYLKENGKFILNQNRFSYFLTNKSVFEILNKQIDTYVDSYKKSQPKIPTKDYPYTIEGYSKSNIYDAEEIIYRACGVLQIGSIGWSAIAVRTGVVPETTAKVQ